MTTAGARHDQRWEVAGIRDAHPIADVVAASGVHLIPRCRGFVGCCPFHDDTTPSLSVDGVPGRFHCFGCGAGGDVIDYVSRLTGMPFVQAVHALQDGTPLGGQPAAVSPAPLRAIPVREPATSPERAFEVNQLAWDHFSAPVAAAHAQAYLRHHRGIDLTALREAGGSDPVVGYASTSWNTLATRLRDRGVTDTELVDLDLAHRRSRAGHLIDAYRGRLIMPVRDNADRIQGFLGRDTTGHPSAPKYRNPTRTPTFDKATILYRPTHHALADDGTVVVVEGPLDALAIVAAAATAGQLPRFAPCSTSGVTVSTTQARAVLALHHRAPVLALDGDPAGEQGTRRWLRLLCITGGRPALVTSLPTGSDPADWLRRHGEAGMAAFDPARRPDASPGGVVPHQPGRELVRACLDGPLPGRLTSGPVPAVLAAVVPLAAQLPTHDREALLSAAEREMSAQGWNPNHQFNRALRRAVDTALCQHGISRTQPAPPAAGRSVGLSTEATRADAPPSRYAGPSLT